MSLIGHQEARRTVCSALSRGALAHALLVTGEAGIGKRAFAEWVVRASWCEAASDRIPCDECPSCRKVLSANHPDLHLVARDPDHEHGSRHEVTVNQIRLGVIPALGLRPLEASGHAVIIDNADEMNEEAQNALLKTLEEPPRGSRLLLTTSREDVLLDTIRSRCQTLRLSPLEDADVKQLCAARGMVVDELLLALARGRPGRLHELSLFDVPALCVAFDGVLSGRLAATAFGRACSEELDRARERLDELTQQAEDTTSAGGPEIDDTRLRRTLLDVLRTHLRDLVLLRSGASSSACLTPAPADPEQLPEAEPLLAADAVLMEAAEDLRRHIPPQVAWSGLGLGLATIGVGVRTGSRP